MDRQTFNPEMENVPYWLKTESGRLEVALFDQGNDQGNHLHSHCDCSHYPPDVYLLGDQDGLTG